MCLIAWNWNPQSDTPLLLLGNRDEYHARPTAGLHWWEDGRVLAGKDLQAGGSWLGVGHQGRLAALTNFRAAKQDDQVRPSRGGLVADFLRGSMGALPYLQAVAAQASHYNPFNLLVYDGAELMGLESRHARILTLAPGLGAVSNADFGTPWPKLRRLQAGLAQQIATGATDVQDLLPLLLDTTQASDAEMPNTGVAPAMERLLSSVHIVSANYGTRASSVVRMGRRQLHFFEQRYTPQAAPESSRFSHHW